MEKRKMRFVVLILILISVAIYGLQILIFHDVRNTAFYILQDFAFMPMTIAIATFIVGELINEQEKKERIGKTRMLTSTFFTQIGTKLVQEVVKVSEPKDELNAIMTMRCHADKDLVSLKDKINALGIKVNLEEEQYTNICEMLKGAQTPLMVLSSNPLLFEHEEFTDLLWTLFHLVDEYNLRGEFSHLSKGDISHLNTDFEEMVKLLMLNYVTNARYIRETYPNLYRTAKDKISKVVETQ